MGHYINRAWIISSTARSIYGFCALCQSLLIGVLIATAAGWLRLGPAHVELSRNIVFFLVLAAAVLDTAMVYFWWSFDQSSDMKKALWALVALLTGFFGVLLYYWRVYRPATATSGNNAAAASQSG